jgi:glucokinase
MATRQSTHRAALASTAIKELTRPLKKAPCYDARMPEYSIGVDFGGTNLRAAAFTSEGEVIERLQVPTGIAQGRESVVANLVSLVQNLRSKRSEANLAGIGVGFPGFIDMKRGVMVGATNIPGFENYPIRDELSRLLGVPIILENDANAAALGEKWMGAGRDVDDLILLTLGTGVGGGIIYCGEVIRGAVGMAGELGHITVVPNGNPCGCGNLGCLESHASATAVESMANQLGLGDNLSSHAVCELANGGNLRARRVFESMGTTLGTALASLINIFNFPLYLIAGGVVDAWDLFSPAMFAELGKRSFTHRAAPARVEKATLGKDAGIFGAAYLPFLEHRRGSAHG